MAIVKVSIKDKNTLELQEDAKKGDTIDLISLSTADVSSVADAVKLVARKEVEQELSALKNKELETELLKKEKELNDKHQKELRDLEKEKQTSAMIVGQKESEIKRLKEEQEKLLETEKKLKQIEINNSVAEKDKELLSLKAELEKKDAAIKLELERKENTIITLTERAKHQEEARALETKRVMGDVEREREKLAEALNTKDTEYLLKEKSLKEQLENKLKEKEDEVAYYKDLKLKTNVKMLGETVEKHCDLAFEQIRGFLPSGVQFGKDTDSSEGSMGDRIYREYDENKNEILSIMFEMKNEGDETKTKQKNEQFFKELDKDRKQKKCEYAVLVTMLEKDNDLYNNGFYTVSENEYKDMFVVRPQEFTKIIMWLRNVAGKLSNSRRELITIQQRDRDYTEFDQQADTIREKFNKHYLAAVGKHTDAVEDIDKMIKVLTKMRENLLGSDKQLRLASEDLDNLTVKKLARNSPSIIEQTKQKKDEK